MHRLLLLLVLAGCEAFAPDAPGATGELTLPGDDHWLLRSDTRVRVLTELGMFLENEL